MDYNQYASMFKALSDETRVQIIAMLSKGELCACNILDEFHITQPTLSYHMKILKKSGLITSRKEGKWMHYAVDEEGMESIYQFINQVKVGQKGGKCQCKS